ncbi:hypothetical protein EYF80_005580 [Liparis tanakae]|uniref:Uncharacterized protein n=1 Tax=Liparis tanakae TaxID=230148 RepID=A0A4Z2J437_9TELE|nr:hypothetical protein EYF80_005580 [Liparis tanakae]
MGSIWSFPPSFNWLRPEGRAAEDQGYLRNWRQQRIPPEVSELLFTETQAPPPGTKRDCSKNINITRRGVPQFGGPDSKGPVRAVRVTAERASQTDDVTPAVLL